jgi:hypothetical protein
VQAAATANRLTIVPDAAAYVVLVIPLNSANANSIAVGLPANYQEREMLRGDLMDVDLARLMTTRAVPTRI